MSMFARIARHIAKPRSWHRLLTQVAAAPRRAMLSGKLKRQKQLRGSQSYDAEPRVAGILQFFNKRGNIPMLWRGIQAAKFDEVIILDDGSVDGSTAEWQNRLGHPNHFLFRSNDLFEIITYDRAIRHTNAEFVCLLQDDDKLPSDDRWVKRAIELFEQFPELLILGGFYAIEVLPCPQGHVADEMKLVSNGNIEGVDNLFSHRSSRFPINNTPSGIDDFYFSMSVVRAPVFIRRREFLDIGGFDLSFAPFLCDDVDNGIRAWNAGYKVGVYDVDFQRDLGLGGMRSFNSRRMEVQVRKNWAKIYEKHGASISSGEVEKMVAAANMDLMKQRQS